MSKLKEIREAKGISQVKLSELSEVNIRMIQHYEQGYKDINKANVWTVYRLATALECDVKDIIETT